MDLKIYENTAKFAAARAQSAIETLNAMLNDIANAENMTEHEFATLVAATRNIAYNIAGDLDGAVRNANTAEDLARRIAAVNS
jgi:hypothetical protein